MYNHKFGDHNIDALVGYSAQKYSNEYNQLTATDFPSDDIAWMGAGATKTVTTTSNNGRWPPSLHVQTTVSKIVTYYRQLSVGMGAHVSEQVINMQTSLPYPPDGLYLTRLSWNR